MDRRLDGGRRCAGVGLPPGFSAPWECASMSCGLLRPSDSWSVRAVDRLADIGLGGAALPGHLGGSGVWRHAASRARRLPSCALGPRGLRSCIFCLSDVAADWGHPGAMRLVCYQCRNHDPAPCHDGASGAGGDGPRQAYRAVATDREAEGQARAAPPGYRVENRYFLEYFSQCLGERHRLNCGREQKIGGPPDSRLRAGRVT